MVACEGFVYKQNSLSVTRNVVVREGWSLVRVVVRQGFYCNTIFTSLEYFSGVLLRNTFQSTVLTHILMGVLSKILPRVPISQFSKVFIKISLYIVKYCLAQLGSLDTIPH